MFLGFGALILGVFTQRRSFLPGLGRHHGLAPGEPQRTPGHGGRLAGAAGGGECRRPGGCDTVALGSAAGAQRSGDGLAEGVGEGSQNQK